MPIDPRMIQYGIMAFVMLLVLVLRTRSLRRQRPLKLEQLWIVPVLYGAVAAYLFWRQPPQGLVWAWVAVGLIAGAAIGWWRGTQMAITIDPDTHVLNQKSSMLAVLFIVGLILVRYGLVIAQQTGTITMNAATLTDPFVAFAMGVFTVTRLEMYLRARRMLERVRAG